MKIIEESISPCIECGKNTVIMVELGESRGVGLTVARICTDCLYKARDLAKDGELEFLRKRILCLKED